MTAVMGPSFGILTILVYFLNWLSNLRHQTVFWPKFNIWELFCLSIELFLCTLNESWIWSLVVWNWSGSFVNWASHSNRDYYIDVKEAFKAVWYSLCSKHCAGAMFDPLLSSRPGLEGSLTWAPLDFYTWILYLYDSAVISSSFQWLIIPT